jgi:uncharacterized protein
MRTVDDILPREAAATLRSCKRTVQPALPNVETLILFGSRARGQARDDSDCDVAVVFRDISDRARVRRTLSDLACEHILEGFYIRPIALPPEYLETKGRRPTRSAEEIIRDGAEVT